MRDSQLLHDQGLGDGDHGVGLQTLRCRTAGLCKADSAHAKHHEREQPRTATVEADSTPKRPDCFAGTVQSLKAESRKSFVNGNTNKLNSASTFNDAKRPSRSTNTIPSLDADFDKCDYAHHFDRTAQVFAHRLRDAVLCIQRNVPERLCEQACLSAKAFFPSTRKPRQQLPANSATKSRRKLVARWQLWQREQELRLEQGENMKRVCDFLVNTAKKRKRKLLGQLPNDGQPQTECEHAPLKKPTIARHLLDEATSCVSRAVAALTRARHIHTCAVSALQRALQLQQDKQLLKNARKNEFSERSFAMQWCRAQLRLFPNWPVKPCASSDTCTPRAMFERALVLLHDAEEARRVGRQVGHAANNCVVKFVRAAVGTEHHRMLMLQFETTTGVHLSFVRKCLTELFPIHQSGGGRFHAEDIERVTQYAATMAVHDPQVHARFSAALVSRIDQYDPNSPLSLLEHFHACSGARLTLNTRRLVSLPESTQCYRRCSALVGADIDKFLQVSTEDSIRQVKSYNKAVRCIDMRTCAVCAARDPDERHVEIHLSSVPNTHWLVVDEAARKEMLNAPAVQLLSDAGEIMTVQQHEFRHLFDDKGRWMHLVGCAVNVGRRSFYACRSCAAAVQKRPKKRNVRSAASDSLFYSEDAPPTSLASGCDYGRMDFISTRYLKPPSTLELLVLGEARSLCVAVKIKRAGPRFSHKLQGHVITFPHHVVNEDHEPVRLCPAVLRAAFARLMVLFLAPCEKGKKSEMCENALLQIPSLQLRPHVLYNFLNIRSKLCGYPSPPPVGEIRSMVLQFNLNKQLDANAIFVENSHVEKVAEAASDDVASVRIEQPVNDDTDASNEFTTNDLPCEVGVGLHDVRAGELRAIIDSVGEALQHPDAMDTSANHNIASQDVAERGETNTHPHDQAEHKARQKVRFQRDALAMNDYSGGGQLMLKTFWPLLPLRQGFRDNEVISQKKVRHMLLHYSNRFAQNLQFLFMSADMLLRHRVNSAVAATI